MADPKPLELTEADHGMNALADVLHGDHLSFCAGFQISPWDYCSALVNVAAWILADSKDMPEAKAMERIDDLQRIMKSAYWESRTAGAQEGRG